MRSTRARLLTVLIAAAVAGTPGCASFGESCLRGAVRPQKDLGPVWAPAYARACDRATEGEYSKPERLQERLDSAERWSWQRGWQYRTLEPP